VRRWLWVTQPEFWAKLPGGQLGRGQKVRWTCNEETRRGDVALLYRADMAKDIAHVFRVEDETPEIGEHPLDPGREVPYCDATLVHTFHHPLLLWDLRNEPGLVGWPPLAVNFNGSSFEIENGIWQVLLGLAHPRDRIELRRHGGA
jgi:hypothetical protein